MLGMTEEIFQVPPQKLASAVLEELPDQLASYYNALRFSPVHETHP